MVHGLLKILQEMGLFLAYRGTGMPVVAVETVEPQSAFWRLNVSRELEARVSLILGGLLVALALGGVALLGGPVAFNEVRQSVRQARVERLAGEKRAEAYKASHVTFADYLGQQLIPSNLNPASSEFGVVIPKIGVNSPVVAQVNANDASEYLPALKQGLAQAAGSAAPGNRGDIFIFGHSTDYAWNITQWNALFYNLKELEVGDKVYVYYQGEPRAYAVTDRAIYDPEDVSFLDPNNEQERLVLQTCWPPGTVLKRLVVFAEPVRTLAEAS